MTIPKNGEGFYCRHRNLRNFRKQLEIKRGSFLKPKIDFKQDSKKVQLEFF